MVSKDGELLARRVLLHAHVKELPFTRSVGGLRVQPDDTVIIRTQMNVGGYGGLVMPGTLRTDPCPTIFQRTLQKTQSPLLNDFAFEKLNLPG